MLANNILQPQQSHNRGDVGLAENGELFARMRQNGGIRPLSERATRRHALHPLHLGLTPHGLRSVMVETSELIRYHTRLFDSREAPITSQNDRLK